MSYAEHGPRIFLTGKFSANPITKNGESVGPRKRSEGRLKLFDSCTDLRAWTSNPYDNCRFFREVVENPLPRGKVVPYDVMIESLNVLGKQTKSELVSLRRQLEKYKSLRLTPEQETQLKDFEDDDKSEISSKNSTTLQRSVRTEDETAIPKRPETPIQSAGSSTTSIRCIEINRRSDDESSSRDQSEDSRDIVVSSESNAELPTKRRRTDKSGSRYGGFDNTNHRVTIIEKDSEIIALKNEIGAKDVELEEFRDHIQSLEAALNEKDALIDNLRDHLRMSQQELIDMSEEYQQKMYTSKCLVDHLKSALAEKSQEVSGHSRKIEELQERIKETEMLRDERDCLGRKLDDMQAVMHDRNELLKLNQEQAMNLADQEEEINRLLELIKRTSAKHDERQMKMKDTLDDLRAVIEVKNSQLSQFDSRNVSIRREFSDTMSFRELSTPEIHKIKCILEDDLKDVENELASRLVERPHECLRHDEINSRARNTIISHENSWNRDKELMECTIEQLTMQASPSNAANGEQDDLHQQIVSKFQASFETIQQLVVELEPYSEERASLIEKINRLKNALGEAQTTAESRDLIGHKEYLSEVRNKHRKQCEEYKQHIARLEHDLAEQRNKSAKIIEGARREKNQRVIDEKIDNQLCIRAKGSIEMIEKLSVALQGAGDCYDEAMAKKHNELEAKEAEITRLREQVASHVSRGQGDQRENEKSHETTRKLNNELKHLQSELAKTHESLLQTKEESKTLDFKLKALKQKLRTQCSRQEQEADKARKKIIGLEKEIEGLNKTVIITGDLQTKVDEMELRLESLQNENTKLNDEILKANALCAEYGNKIIDLTNRETRAQEDQARTEEKWRTLVLQRASQIESLRIENETANEELEANKKKISKLTEELQSLKVNTKKLDIIDNVMREIAKVDKNINKLLDDVTTLRLRLENGKRGNDKLENDLTGKLAENAQLEIDIRELNENIERMSSTMMPTATAKQVLDTLPQKIYGKLGILRSQLNVSEPEAQRFRSEIDEWRAKSEEDALLIESLRHEIKQYNNKALHPDAIIAALQRTNADLKSKLEQIETSFAESSRLTEEVRQKDEEIEARNCYIEKLKMEQRSLEIEKTKLLERFREEEESHKHKLGELQQNFITQKRQIRAEHNASIIRLQSEYEGSLSKPFNADTWLKSLSPSEMAEWCMRIHEYAGLTLSETMNDGFKVGENRSQQFQQNLQPLKEELEHRNKFYPPNGHREEYETGLTYKYDTKINISAAQHDPTEFALASNDKKKKDFIRLCANQHDRGNRH